MYHTSYYILHTGTGGTVHVNNILRLYKIYIMYQVFKYHDAEVSRTRRRFMQN